MEQLCQGKLFVMGQLDGVRFLIAHIFGWCFQADIASKIKYASNHNRQPNILSNPSKIDHQGCFRFQCLFMKLGRKVVNLVLRCLRCLKKQTMIRIEGMIHVYLQFLR